MNFNEPYKLDKLEIKMNTLKFNWELGIYDKETMGTITIASYNLLEEAIKGLKSLSDDTGFIDLWVYEEESKPQQVEQYLTKIKLNQLIKGE